MDGRAGSHKVVDVSGRVSDTILLPRFGTAEAVEYSLVTLELTSDALQTATQAEVWLRNGDSDGGSDGGNSGGGGGDESSRVDEAHRSFGGFSSSSWLCLREKAPRPASGNNPARLFDRGVVATVSDSESTFLPLALLALRRPKWL